MNADVHDQAALVRCSFEGAQEPDRARDAAPSRLLRRNARASLSAVSACRRHL